MQTLSHSNIELKIQDPGEIYRGSRFDWTGQIVQMTWQGRHTFCTSELLQGDIDLGGKGFYNEFGIDEVAGYEQCKPGGQFHKIGTGMLTRIDNSPYSFQQAYPLEPLSYTTERNKTSMAWETCGRILNGFGYTLRKKVSLLESGFCIDYELRNEGEQVIKTNEYVHNFMSINGRNTGNAYQLEFSSEIHPESFGETVNPENRVEFDANKVFWKCSPLKPFFFSNLCPFPLTRAEWKLQHTGEGVGIRETLHAPVLRVNLWGTRHVISPEIFCAIRLLPGESCRWRREYAVFHVQESMQA